MPDRMSSPIARACSANDTESGRSLLTWVGVGLGLGLGFALGLGLVPELE